MSDPSAQLLLNFLTPDSGPNDHLHEAGGIVGGDAEHGSGTPLSDDEQDLEEHAFSGADGATPPLNMVLSQAGPTTAIPEVIRQLKRRKKFSSESEADLDKYAQVRTFDACSLQLLCSILLTDTLN